MITTFEYIVQLIMQALSTAMFSQLLRLVKPQTSPSDCFWPPYSLILFQIALGNLVRSPLILTKSQIF